MTWIFLNKNNADEYIEMFAAGCGTKPTCLETWHYEDSDAPLVLRGIMKHKIIKRCWQDRRPFLYMDSGYLGNRPNKKNPGGWKHWHRIVHNDLQHGSIIDRPCDRFEKLGIKIAARQTGGRNILLVAPDQKPCVFYDTTLESWMETTVDSLRQHTDRPIQIRERPISRIDRKTQNTQDWLSDVHAVVTFNSTAATECVLSGVPVFVTAPTNAAKPMSNTNLCDIEKPWFPDAEQIYKWACHLAYGQFHINELANGTAAAILKETVDA